MHHSDWEAPGHAHEPPICFPVHRLRTTWVQMALSKKSWSFRWPWTGHSLKNVSAVWPEQLVELRGLSSLYIEIVYRASPMSIGIIMAETNRENSDMWSDHDEDIEQNHHHMNHHTNYMEIMFELGIKKYLMMRTVTDVQRWPLSTIFPSLSST